MINMKKTLVTKPYLPPIDRYKNYIDKIWGNEHLTNHGPFLNELESKLKNFLSVDYFHFVTNGTLALQLALRALDITEGEIITTPFSYVATTSSILWERCTPVFVDINPETFCIDVQKIESAITPKTKAIMAVHVFGYPCDVEALQNIATRYGLKIIYDGAHAFGCTYKGKSLLNYGDISTCSFHATKVFHTIEGGCIIANTENLHRHLALIRSFGHIGDEHFELGINAKGSEFQAIMGLCNLDDFSKIQGSRKHTAHIYDTALPLDKIQRPIAPKDFEYNYSYYPIVLPTAEKCSDIIAALNQNNIFPRRYFYPSLNTLPYIENANPCPISESLASRIICLPYYTGIEDETIRHISKIISDIV